MGSAADLPEIYVVGYVVGYGWGTASALQLPFAGVGFEGQTQRNNVAAAGSLHCVALC